MAYHLTKGIVFAIIVVQDAGNTASAPAPAARPPSSAAAGLVRMLGGVDGGHAGSAVQTMISVEQSLQQYFIN